MSSLNSGLADLSVIVVAYSSDKVPMNGIPLLPGMGTTSVEMVGAYRRALSQDGILAGEYAAIDTVPLLVSILPAYQVFSTIGPIDTLEKFAGFKVRVSGGSPTFMAQSLGAIPIEINATDMYIALQRKTVDGTFLTMSSAKPYAIHELVNAVSTNGSFGSGSSVLAMDRGKFERCHPNTGRSLSIAGSRPRWPLPNMSMPRTRRCRRNSSRWASTPSLILMTCWRSWRPACRK